MPLELRPLPPRDAIASFEARGYRFPESFNWQDLYADDHARAFTVAKSAGFDILKDIHAGLDGALREGRTERDFIRELTPLLQAKGWWGRQQVINPRTGLPEMAQLGSTRRLELIFAVNMRVSYAAGQWTQFERNRRARPFLRYVHLVGQEHPRLQHKAWHNTVLPIDHPWWQTHACPNGWNCHCTLQSLSQRDIDRLQREGEQLRFEPVQEDLQPWTNKVTGETRMIDRGIDPGWDHNPGRAGHHATLATANKLIDAPPELGAELAADTGWLGAAHGGAFVDWLDAAIGGEKAPLGDRIVTVGALLPDLVAILEARGVRPATAAITLDQRQVAHLVRPSKPDAQRVPVEWLQRMPDLLHAPLAILRQLDNGNLLYVFDRPEADRMGKVVVEMDFATKGPAPQRRRLTTNAIRSAGLVARSTLTDVKSYELLWGRL